MSLTTIKVVKDENELVYGVTAKEWAVKWWLWFLESMEQSQTSAQNVFFAQPIKSTAQDKVPVFFAPTKYMVPGDKEILSKTSKIKRDMAIMISIDKWISFGYIGLSSEEKMRQVAKERIDRLTRINLSLDGEQIITGPKSELVTRITTPVFHVELKNDIMDLELGPKKVRKGRYKAVTDGYWLFIKPNSLDYGEHKIDTFGSCDNGRLSLNVKHHFTII
jgi:hypothetical protein